MAHVYPVALFHNAMILPQGVECDDCNEFAGSLERELLSHNRIGIPIVLRAIPGRNAKVRTRIGNVERNPETGYVRLHGRATLEFTRNAELQLNAPDIARLDDGRFRRALHHIGLNHLALTQGATMARESRYDDVRRYVRFGSPRSPWMYAQFMHPDDSFRHEIGCSHFRWEAGTIIRIRTFHDDFYVDLDGEGFLEAWARRTLPPSAGLL